jgi:HrpA-like RNA helicase
MKAIGIENILKFDFMDQPDVLSLCNSMNQL